MKLDDVAAKNTMPITETGSSAFVVYQQMERFGIEFPSTPSASKSTSGALTPRVRRFVRSRLAELQPGRDLSVESSRPQPALSHFAAARRCAVFRLLLKRQQLADRLDQRLTTGRLIGLCRLRRHVAQHPRCRLIPRAVVTLRHHQKSRRSRGWFPDTCRCVVPHSFSV